MSGRADPASSESASSEGDWQRLDKWLWCARFLKARADCARLIAAGYVRINRQATDKAHARLRIGDVITLPLRGQVIVVRVRGLAARRGPAPEARALYEEIPPAPATEAVPCASSQSWAYAAADDLARGTTDNGT